MKAADLKGTKHWMPLLIQNRLFVKTNTLAQSQTTPYTLPLRDGETLAAQRGSLLSDGGSKYSGKLWDKLPSLRQKQEMP